MGWRRREDESTIARETDIKNTYLTLYTFTFGHTFAVTLTLDLFMVQSYLTYLYKTPWQKRRHKHTEHLAGLSKLASNKHHHRHHVNGAQIFFFADCMCVPSCVRGWKWGTWWTERKNHTKKDETQPIAWAVSVNKLRFKMARKR